MEPKIIEYADGGVEARITVRQSGTTLDAVRSGLLRAEADAASYDDPAMKVLHQGIYIHALVASNGELAINGKKVIWPPDIHTFADLPVRLTNQWIDAVYVLNPVWDPTGLAGEEPQEKKVLNGGSGESTG